MKKEPMYAWTVYWRVGYLPSSELCDHFVEEHCLSFNNILTLWVKCLTWQENMVAEFVPESTPEPVHRKPEPSKENDEVTKILAVKRVKVIDILDKAEALPV